MKHGLIKSFETRLYFAKSRGDKSPYSHLTYAALNVLADARHYMSQNIQDLDRRGMTNREGTNNRRYRKYLKARRTRIVTCGNAFEIVA